MSKQWSIVGAVIALLGVAAVAMIKFMPDRGRVAVDAPAPDYRAIDLATGDSVSLLQRYRGSVTLVNIWATWCVPCRQEMPAMQRAYAALKDRGFRIAAVSIDDGSPEDVKKFVQELGLTFDVLQDRSMGIQQVYQTTGVPESFLLDKDGRIIKRVIGAHDWSSGTNRALIERYLIPGS